MTSGSRDGTQVGLHQSQSSRPYLNPRKTLHSPTAKHLLHLTDTPHVDLPPQWMFAAHPLYHPYLSNPAVGYPGSCSHASRFVVGSQARRPSSLFWLLVVSPCRYPNPLCCLRNRCLSRLPCVLLSVVLIASEQSRDISQCSRCCPHQVAVSSRLVTF